MTARVLVVGVGAEGRASLPETIRQRIDSADALWGSRRLLAHFADHPAPKTVLETPPTAQLEALRTRGDRRIVVLASGDPGFFGIAATILRHLPPAEVEIIPHVTSLQWAFARAGLDWNGAVFTSAHARPLAEVVGWARRSPRLGILTDPAHTPGVIAQAMLAAGIEDCRAIVAENLGLPEERLIDSRLVDVAQQDFAPLNVMLLVRPDNWRPQPVFAPREDTAYVHRRGLITKAEMRALSLAALALSESDTAWDIGAGSGAMSIEMAQLAWRGQVFAIEQDAENLGYLHENIKHHGALNVIPVAGRAPDALVGLPPPRAVFIGGSGGELAAILALIARVADAGCRVVANLATLEHLIEAQTHMERLGWSPTLLQINIARQARLAGLTRLSPLNPVFIVWGELPCAR